MSFLLGAELQDRKRHLVTRVRDDGPSRPEHMQSGATISGNKLALSYKIQRARLSSRGRGKGSPLLFSSQLEVVEFEFKCVLSSGEPAAIVTVCHFPSTLCRSCWF